MKTKTIKTTSIKSLRDLIAKSNPLGGRKQEQSDK
jgi:hypothetical protein